MIAPRIRPCRRTTYSKIDFSCCVNGLAGNNFYRHLWVFPHPTTVEINLCNSILRLTFNRLKIRCKYLFILFSALALFIISTLILFGAL